MRYQEIKELYLGEMNELTTLFDTNKAKWDDQYEGHVLFDIKKRYSIRELIQLFLLRRDNYPEYKGVIMYLHKNIENKELEQKLKNMAFDARLYKHQNVSTMFQTLHANLVCMWKFVTWEEVRYNNEESEILHKEWEEDSTYVKDHKTAEQLIAEIKETQNKLCGLISNCDDFNEEETGKDTYLELKAEFTKLQEYYDKIIDSIESKRNSLKPTHIKYYKTLVLLIETCNKTIAEFLKD